jgi:hypothetical protein
MLEPGALGAHLWHVPELGCQTGTLGQHLPERILIDLKRTGQAVAFPGVGVLLTS